MTEKLFGSALCAVGGARGGTILPRWFGALAELGVRQVCLFWAVPAGPHAAEELDVLRAGANRWMADLRALGIASELVIKRGRPGPWLTALAAICESDLIVAGPPAVAGGVSDTLEHLLEASPVPLLVLPDAGPADGELLLRPVVERAAHGESRATLDAWTRGRASRLVQSDGLDAAVVATTMLRLAETTGATAHVVSGALPGLAARLLRRSALPLLVARGRQPARPHRAERGPGLGITVG
jgi:hypothetical protein